MFQLLQPVWLYSLAGIAIPVIIHFWNQRPGRTLKVGSIALIAEDSKEYKRSLKLSDLLLLFIRCLLIGALSVALSSPTWQRPMNSGREKGWILIAPDNTGETYAHFKTLIDSLQKAGLETRIFDGEFRKEKLEDILAKPAGSNNKNKSYWSIAALLDQTIPGAVPAFIFSDNYLRHFSGSRPALQHHFNWYTYTPSDSNARVQTEPNLPGSPQRAIIFTDKYANDARYLKAALDAIFTSGLMNLSVTGIDNKDHISAQLDWLFWLSDQPVQNGVKAKNIFRYQPGEIKSSSSFILAGKSADGPAIELFRSVSAADSSGNGTTDLWMDGFGHPVLSTRQKDSTAEYFFYSHFDPSWNELVWSDQFPSLLYGLMAHPSIAGNEMVNDNRIIDGKQLLPVSSRIPLQAGNSPKTDTINLTPAFWMLVLLLFVLERLVSSQNSKLKANG